MAINDGNDQQSAVGFFNPMLGGGEAVGAFGGGGWSEVTVKDPWKVGSVSEGYTDGGGVERTRDVLTVYLPEGSLNIAGEELEVYDLNWGPLDPVAADDSVYYVLPSAQRSRPSDVWLNIYSLDDSDDGTSGGETSGSTEQELPSYKACISLSEAGPGAPSGYKLFTTIRICSVATEALDGTKISKLTQAVVGAITLDGGGSGSSEGGTIVVGEQKTAIVSVEYIDGETEDYFGHFVLRKGKLTLTQNTLEIVPDDSATRFIPTTPISEVVSADCLIPE
jgi:hypothetical protein